MKVLSLILSLVLLVGLSLTVNQLVNHTHERILEVASPEGFSLSPGGGYNLTPGYFSTNQFGTTTLGLGTSTPAQEVSAIGDLMLSSSGTTTLFLDSIAASKGSCIQMKAATSSTIFRMYISESNAASGSPIHLLVERGACQ